MCKQYAVKSVYKPPEIESKILSKLFSHPFVPNIVIMPSITIMDGRTKDEEKRETMKSLQQKSLK